MKKITLLLLFIVSQVYSQDFSDHIIDNVTVDALATQIVDLDSDGDLDIITAFYNEPTTTGTGKLVWYENDGFQNYTQHNVDITINGALYLTAADVNGDNKTDILLSAYDGNALYAFINNGGTPNTFLPKITIDATAVGSNYVSASDFDGDSVMDAVSANYGGNELAWYKYTPPLTITKNIIDSAATLVSSVETGDMDGDLDMDLVVTANNEVLWYENDGTGTFTKHTIPASTGFTGSITAYMFDFDLDGDMDIIASASSADEVAWFENDGSQVFTKHIVATGVDYASYAKPVDFNNDGNIDIVVSATNANELLWFENDGTNLVFTQHLVGNGNSLGDAYGLDVADIDGDGDVDIALTSPGPNIFRWLENDFIGPPANDICTNAFPLACGNLYSGDTTDSTDNGDDLSTNFGMGKGIWYKYIGNDQTITIDISNQSVDMEVGVAASADCVTFTGAISSDSAGSSSTESITFDADAGTTYYIYVAYYGDTSTTTGTFDLAISCMPYPDCPDVLNIIVGNFTSPGNADLSWDVSAGAAGYNWEIQPQGAAQGDGTMVESGSVTTNSSLATMLIDGTDYTLFVQSDCSSSMLGNWFSYDFIFNLPPSNDDCLGATLLLEQENMIDYASTTPYASTILGATDSGLVATACDGFTGTANDDVWFKFVATTSALHITLEDDFDGVMNLFDGDCTTLNLLDCADSGANPQIDATSLTVGNTYYIRVYNYYISTTSTPNFNISVWMESTASATELSSVGFEYFPNPVNNNLTVKANQNITSIAIFNMLGQQVKQVNPSSLNAQVDMTNLANGTYFIKATVGEKVGTFKIVKK